MSKPEIIEFFPGRYIVRLNGVTIKTGFRSVGEAGKWLKHASEARDLIEATLSRNEHDDDGGHNA